MSGAIFWRWVKVLIVIATIHIKIKDAQNGLCKLFGASFEV